MRKIIVMVAMIIIGCRLHAQEPIAEIIKAGIKKVIVAVDLKIQRLQTKTIWLQNAQKVMENTMSKIKLEQIAGWVQKQKDLYQKYFDELWKVKDALGYYFRVRAIMDQQLALVRQYHVAWNGVRADIHFSAPEILYIGQVYTGIIEKSLQNLEQLSLVVRSFTTRMSDAKRIEVINEVADRLQENYDDLKSFNSENIRLSLQRSKDEHEIAVVKLLYHLQ